MAEAVTKSFASPDEVVDFPGISTEIIELGELTVGRQISEPGWRWSKDVRPVVGGEWCQARHVGYVAAGSFGIELSDGKRYTFSKGDVFDIPPGHDGYTIGDERCELIEWRGIRAFTGFVTGVYSRVLATLLFTDLVESTAIASELGDARWRELLSGHFEAARAELERFGGREVKTTGDGLLARFDGAARALHCAAAIRARASRDGLHVRAGVHVGEVELVGDDVRGVTVHEASRIMAAAGPDEILVSELTRALAGASLRYEDRGTHALKGLEGEWHLAAYVPEG
jgi:class 3 adenylate cyclase